jgi:hypothetical protein
MIDLPTAAMTAVPALLDNGLLQRTAFGGASNRLNRKGNRYRVQFTVGPFYSDVGRGWVSDLIAGKTEGVRIAYPLPQSQGSPGNVLIDGAGQEGTSIDVKGGTPGHFVKKGYWLSIENDDGRHYLHNVRAGVRFAADGTATLEIRPELRHPFDDEAVVHLAKPYIEGWVDGDEWAWSVNADQVVPISFTVEEAE